MFDMKQCVYCGFNMSDDNAHLVIGYHYDGKDAYLCRSCHTQALEYWNNQ